MRFVFLLFILLPFSVKAQEYTRLINLAHSTFNQKNYTTSSLYFDSAFAVSAGENFPLYDAACSHSLAGNLKKSIRFLMASLEEEEQNFDWMYYDKDL
ncbi:MAG TPA: hypothetical protein VFU05_16430, partial [Cyclobacteriaceae bacterium]|nr:hypothetical protein [Cyclobacteriaceae bacterium]